MSQSHGRPSLTDILHQISLRAIRGVSILMMTSSRCRVAISQPHRAEDPLLRGMIMRLEGTGCKTLSQAPMFRLIIIMRSRPSRNITSTATGRTGAMTVTSWRDTTVTLTTAGVFLAHPRPRHGHPGRPLRPAPADEGVQQGPCTPRDRPTPGGTPLPLNPGGPAEPALLHGVTLTTTRPRSTSGRPRSGSTTSPSRAQGADQAAAPALASPAGRGQPGPAGPLPPPPGPRTTLSRS